MIVLTAPERVSLLAHFRAERRKAAHASDFGWYRAIVQAEREVRVLPLVSSHPVETIAGAVIGSEVAS